MFKAHYSAPIEMAATFETLTLHELGHTRAGGSTIDIRYAPGVVVVGQSGWLYLRSLGALAWKTAEGNAYHGLIGYLIAKMGLLPLADGTLVSIAKPSATSR